MTLIKNCALTILMLLLVGTALPASAEFKAWVMAKLPDTPEGLGID